MTCILCLVPMFWLLHVCIVLSILITAVITFQPSREYFTEYFTTSQVESKRTECFADSRFKRYILMFSFLNTRQRLENVTIVLQFDFRLYYICLTCKIVAVVKEILFSRLKQRKVKKSSRNLPNYPV